MGFVLHSKVARLPSDPEPTSCTSEVIPRVAFLCKGIGRHLGQEKELRFALTVSDLRGSLP